MVSPITAVKGTSFLYPSGATGVTGLTPGTTYYISANVSASTSVTLASSYNNAIAGTTLTISGTPGGTLTGVVLGASYASVASVAVLSGGLYTGTYTTTALTPTTSASSGAGLTLTVNYSVAVGTTFTANSGVSTVVIDSLNTATVTAANVILPSSPPDRFKFRISSLPVITTANIYAPNGATIKYTSSGIFGSGNTQVQFTYQAANSTWYRS